MADLDPLLDRLYSAALGDFVAVRRQLSSELTEQGDRDGAARVKGLKKPVVSAWVVNQLALRGGAEWESLLDAGEEVRQTQGRSSGSDVHRAAVTQRRRALDRLLDRAEEVLSEAGHAATQGTIQRISRSLETVAVYGRTGACDPAPGRLQADLEPPGFDVLLELATLRPTGTRKETSKATAARSRRDAKGEKITRRAGSGESSPGPSISEADEQAAAKRRARAQALRKERIALAKQVDSVRSQSKTLAKARRDKERRLESKEKTIDKARQRLAELEQAGEELEKSLAESRQAHRQAELSLMELERRLRRIDAELADVKRTG